LAVFDKHECKRKIAAGQKEGSKAGEISELNKAMVQLDLD
jgi:hypothetical protein